MTPCRRARARTAVAFARVGTRSRLAGWVGYCKWSIIKVGSATSQAWGYESPRVHPCNKVHLLLPMSSLNSNGTSPHPWAGSSSTGATLPPWTTRPRPLSQRAWVRAQQAAVAAMRPRQTAPG